MTAPSWLAPPDHPVAGAVAGMHAELDLIIDSPASTISGDELAVLLTDLARLQSRLVELTGRVAVAADRAGVADTAGATSTAVWWAHHTRQTRSATHRVMRLAESLDRGHEPVRVALAEGELLADQARVIVAAVDDLPADLVDARSRDAAEAHLVDLARHHHADELRRLGRHLLEVVAPEAAEAHLARQLEAEESAARDDARLTMSDDGRGRTRGRFTLPTAQAQMLHKHLMALASPRRDGSDSGAERRPLPQRLGRAFLEYVERYPASATPDAGGVAATVVVTMSLDSLLGGDTAASLDTGVEISAAQARRLACEAGVIPAVLGGAGQVLDLGRERRFHSKAQRIALRSSRAAAPPTAATGRPACATPITTSPGTAAATPTSRPAACSARATTPASTTRRTPTRRSRTARSRSTGGRRPPQKMPCAA